MRYFIPCHCCCTPAPRFNLTADGELRQLRHPAEKLLVPGALILTGKFDFF
jgi:hypothetical protein